MRVTNQIFPFSASPTSLPIPISQTTSPGTLIHTSSATASLKDILWIWAINISTEPVILTVVKRNGETTLIDNIIHLLPQANKVQIEPGSILVAGTEYLAYASIADVIHISGWTTRRNEIL